MKKISKKNLKKLCAQMGAKRITIYNGIDGEGQFDLKTGIVIYQDYVEEYPELVRRELKFPPKFREFYLNLVNEELDIRE